MTAIVGPSVSLIRLKHAGTWDIQTLQQRKKKKKLTELKRSFPANCISQSFTVEKKERKKTRNQQKPITCASWLVILPAKSR